MCSTQMDNFEPLLSFSEGLTSEMRANLTSLSVSDVSSILQDPDNFRREAMSKQLLNETAIEAIKHLSTPLDSIFLICAKKDTRLYERYMDLIHAVWNLPTDKRIVGISIMVEILKDGCFSEELFGSFTPEQQDLVTELRDRVESICFDR